MYFMQLLTLYNHGFFWGKPRETIFFDDGGVVSSRPKWSMYFSAILPRVLTSSTYQKYVQMHDKTHPYMNSQSPPPISFIITSFLDFGQRHNNDRAITTRNEGVFDFPQAPGRGQAFSPSHLHF